MTAIVTQAAGVFGTGILASLSPCVYPMIPITLGFLGSQAKSGNRKSVYLYVLGQCLAFMALGVVAVQLGETLGFSSQSPWVNISIGALLVIAGVFSFRGKLPGFLNRWNDVGTKLSAQRSGGLLTAFIMGVSAALIASPCTSPILGGVLTLMASSASMAEGMFLMFMYSAGFSLVFLILGLGALKMNRLPRAGKWMVWVHKGTSALLVVAGLYFVYFGFQEI